jgi:prepilin-type N-terminal cleavage/methylation domain-containing protein
MKRTQRHISHGAFTLIELLVVISIIAILIGIMSVGMNKVKKIAENLRQKVEFKAMEVGLELFAKDFESYPESRVLPNITAGSDIVCGAQHLAEALVGRDNRGFEPQSGWYPTDDRIYNAQISPAVFANFYDSSQDASLKRRKQPYVDFKYSGVYTIAELWQGGFGPSTIYTSSGMTNRQRSPVITDTFRRNEITVGGNSVKVGMPVLYFKADSSKRFRIDLTKNVVTNPASAEYSKWSYNFDDNLPVLQLPGMVDTALPEMDYKKAVGDSAAIQAQNFYESITQTSDATRKFFKPYNAETFILISAGWDGIYGTKDDITNFNY